MSSVHFDLKTLLDLKGIKCSDLQANSLEDYMLYILKKNEEVNLTAIKDPDEFKIRMIFDSALPLKLISFDNKKVLDIGTGAGYPGTVIATLSEAKVTMIDSTSKKLDVINDYKGRDYYTVHTRAEKYVLTHRNAFDIVIARAVAELPILLELALPLTKVGGYFVAMKGKEAEAEIEKSKKALIKLHAHIEKTQEVILPTGEKRINILVKKDEETPKKFPREYKEIKANPL